MVIGILSICTCKQVSNRISMLLSMLSWLLLKLLYTPISPPCFCQVSAFLRRIRPRNLCLGEARILRFPLARVGQHLVGGQGFYHATLAEGSRSAHDCDAIHRTPLVRAGRCGWRGCDGDGRGAQGQDQHAGTLYLFSAAERWGRGVVCVVDFVSQQN